MAVVGLYISGLGLALTGLEPSAEEAFRVVIFFLFSGVYISVWLALAIIFSVVCRHAATAALACISIWLFLSMFMSLVASGDRELDLSAGGNADLYQSGEQL